MKAYRRSSAIVGSWERGGPELTEGDIAKIRLGLDKARVAAKTNDWRSVWIVTNTAKPADLDGHAAVAGAIGEANARALRVGRDVPWEGFMLRHASTKTLAARESILAIHPMADLLAKLDDLMSPNAVCVVPFLDDDVRAWIEAWGPIDILNNNEQIPPLEIKDAAVLEAVRQMTSTMTGLGHPSDERRARDTFSRLRKNHQVDPAEIRAYVVRETGWNTIQADKLATIAAGHQRRSMR